MGWVKDITGTDVKKKGTFRSLNGAADENIFIGRASKAGFYCFFKVWRDMPYDAVLDYNGILYRVEVKGGSNNKFNVTRGTRSGKQIKKDMSRTKLLSREDCDFVVGVDSNTGECYIIPEDVVEIIDLQNLSQETVDSYKEKWKLLMYGDNYLTAEQTRDGIKNLSDDDLIELARILDVKISKSAIVPKGTRKKIKREKDKLIFKIWETIANSL